MKILLLNTYENFGGAALATKRIYEALLNSQKDIDLKFISKKNRFGKYSFYIIYLTQLIERVILKLYLRKNSTPFSINYFNSGIGDFIKKEKPDVINIFWISGGLTSIKEISGFKGKIFWTLHDMWPFTGGCHYNMGCEKFSDNCGACEQLGSKNKFDITWLTLNNKKNQWKKVDITIIATSVWMANEVKKSKLFCNNNIYIIPNCIDINSYKKNHLKDYRKKYSILKDSKVTLFSAFGALDDPRKGYDLLIESLRYLNNIIDFNIHLLINGVDEDRYAIAYEHPRLKISYYSNLSIEDQIQLYNCADILVAPSRQENLSNTVMESMACSTPVVAFKIGGMPDLIDHKINGYLAKPFDVKDLAYGIKFAFDNQKYLASGARLKVETNFSYDVVSKKYLEVYGK